MKIGDVLVLLQDNNPPPMGKYAIVMKRVKSGRIVVLQVPLETGEYSFIPLPDDVDLRSTENVYQILANLLPKKRKMSAGGGKGKGSGYEREIGYKLSLWLSKGLRKDIVCRTVGSGAQFTSANVRGTTAGIPGDLRSQDPLADKFFSSIVLECKFWRDLEWLRFLDGEGLLHDAMVKVKEEADSLNKFWWLCARQNRRYDILLMPLQGMSRCGLDIPSVPFHSLFSGTVLMYKLDQFLLSIASDKYLEKVL